MFMFSRYDTMTELALLCDRNLNGRVARTFFKELYFECLEIIVETLNSEEHARLIDRLDEIFSQRQIDPSIRGGIFDFILYHVEKIRLQTLLYKFPSFVKYKVEINYHNVMFFKDFIVVDFEQTFISYHKVTSKKEIEYDLITDQPTIEQLNETWLWRE